MDICNLNFLCLVLFSWLYGLVILYSECIFVFVRESILVSLILHEIFEDPVSVTLFDPFKHFGADYSTSH